MRILQIGMTDNLGGIENYLMNYYRNINKEKIQFDFVNIYQNNLCFQEEIESLGGKVYKVSSYYKHPLKYINELKKIIKDNNYEIVHCNMNSAVMLYPLIAAKLVHTKVIIAHSHNASSDKGLLKSILHSINKHFIPLFANTYFACSKKAGEWFYSKKILNSDKFYVINNAININDFKFDSFVRSEMRNNLKIGKDEIVLCHVGRFNKQKNHEFLIKAFKEIQQKNSKTKLMLIGIGPLLEQTKELAKKLRLENDVIFLGQRNDVYKLMCSADIFVLPSLYEGLPLVGVEAQASGLKCYISNNVTKEVQLLNETEFLPLEIDKWSDIANCSININRNKCLSLCESFDIHVCAETLAILYKKLGENNE